MSHTTEQAESGAPIHRYKPRADSPELVPPVYADGAQIAAHLATYVGGSGMVFHELVSTDIHLDVHAMAPTAERPYYTLVTSGMSAKPMNVPNGAPWGPYAELLLCLPPDWKLAHSDLKDPNNYWPILWLKRLARFPHEYSSSPSADASKPLRGE